MVKPAYTIRTADWRADQLLLKQVRHKVFVEEQRVPLTLEWDGEDAKALHLLALDSNQHPIGTARLLPSGQIGRMAVIKEWRNRGIGSALLKRLFAEAKEGEYPILFLNAQLSALPFYVRLGFSVAGEVFFEASIPHRRMTRKAMNG